MKGVGIQVKDKTQSKELIKLSEIARLFLKLGIVGFGGPAVHISMMREEVVVKRRWLDDGTFTDLLGAVNLIPGPNSTELAIHIGREKAGWKGLLVAGICFIVPAVLITAALAFLYVEYGHLPALASFFYGIKPAIIAVILAAVFPLARQSAKSPGLIFIGMAAFVCSLIGISEAVVIFSAGIAAILPALVKKSSSGFAVPFGLTLLQVPINRWTDQSTANIFFAFLKIGAILYGSGYVLFAYIETEFVTTGLLSRQQLIDAVAVGQFTPGPVFSSVTFVGYILGGWEGALSGTLGIFLPSFAFVALLAPLIKTMRRSGPFASFLDGVNIASVAAIAAICVEFAKDVLPDWRGMLIAIVSFVVVFRFRKLNSAFVILGGALAGFLLSMI